MSNGNPLAQLGQQMGDAFSGIAKDVSSGATKAASEVAGATIENLLTGGNTAQVADQKKTEEDKQKEEMEKAKRKADEKRRYNAVKEELSSYVDRKRQLDARIAQDKAREQQEQKKKEMVEKQEKDSWVQQMMRRVKGGSHGETDRQKE